VELFDDSGEPTGRSIVGFEWFLVSPVVEGDSTVSGTEGAPVAATATFSGDPAHTHTATIEWGDGSSPEPASVSDAGGAGQVLGTHAYADDGGYTITVRVTSSTGAFDEITLEATIANAAPTVQVGGMPPATVGALLQLTASFSDGGPADTHTAIVSWGDGATTAGLVTPGSGGGSVTASHTYANAGVYTVTVAVTDDDGGTGGGTAGVQVNRAASTTTLASAPNPAGAGESVTFTAIVNGVGATGTVVFQDGPTSLGTAPLNGGTANLSTAALSAGVHAITASYTGDENNMPSTSPPLAQTVGNAAPTVVPEVVQPVVEGTVVTLRAHFTGAAADTHTGTISPGDGTPPQPAAIAEAGGSGTATLVHRFVDNGSYAVTFTIVANRGGAGSATSMMTVTNAAPAASLAGPTDGARGQPRTFTLVADDASPVDRAAGFTFTVDWGDGNHQTVAGPSGVQAEHVFTDDGAFFVRVTATDKDGGVSSEASHGITIAALTVDGSTLVVGGTPGRDTIIVQPAATPGDVAVRLNGVAQGTFRPTEIVVYGQGGNDHLELRRGGIAAGLSFLDIPATLDGGSGNDLVDARGSTASNVLLGGDGADGLLAGRGRDVLIGGSGSDALIGGSDEDLLIAGHTAFDADLAALEALRAEWSAARGYPVRVANLRGSGSGPRLNGSFFLTPGLTVFDDGAVDVLIGGAALDWYLANGGGGVRDLVVAETREEIVEDL
jgi:hypothetical protein